MTTSFRTVFILSTYASLLGLAGCTTPADEMGDPPDISGEGSTGSAESPDTDDPAMGSTGTPDDEDVQPSTGDVDDETGGETSGETGEVEDTEGEATGETGDVLPEAPEDGDNPAEPALLVQFRATSPAPLAFDAPLFNPEAIDTRGAQYSNALSIPGDDLDVVDFQIVPGQVDPYVHIELACDASEQNRVRARLLDDEGSLVDTILCGEGEVDVLLEDASSTDVHQLQVEVLDGAPLLVDYTLSVNGFCFQQCEYVPYVP